MFARGLALLPAFAIAEDDEDIPHAEAARINLAAILNLMADSVTDGDWSGRKTK